MRTEQQKQNIKTHIKFLRDNADKIRPKFHMEFVNDSNGCRCAWGFVPDSLGVDIHKSVILEDQLREVFGMTTSEGTYCFASFWWPINNTPEAAAARMEAVLYDQKPDVWDSTPEFAHPIVVTPEAAEALEKQTQIQKAIATIKAMIF